MQKIIKYDFRLQKYRVVQEFKRKRKRSPKQKSRDKTIP